MPVTGASNASIATTLAAEGFCLPRDGAFDFRHAPSSGFNIDNGWPGNPSAWTAATVAAIKASSTYTDLSASGFPGSGSHALTV